MKDLWSQFMRSLESPGESNPDFLDLIVSGLLAVVTGVLFVPFIDTFYSYGFEPDLDIAAIQSYLKFFATGSPSAFTPLSMFPPYLDGQYSLYAAVAWWVGKLHALGHVGADVPTSVACIHYSIRHVNLVCRMGASAFAYLFFKDLSRSRPAAVALALLMILCPILIEIDLTRIDQFFLLPLLATLYFSLRIVRGDLRPVSLGALGLSAGVVLSSKLSGVPIVGGALLALWMQRARLKRADWLRAGISGLLVLVLLDLRMLFTLSTFPTGLWLKFEHLQLWNTYLGPRPYFKYHWNDFIPYGSLFMASALAAALLVLHEIRRTRDRVCIYLVANFLLYSALLIPALKYARGGYMLTPIYLGFMALALPVTTARISSRWRWAAPLAALGFFCLSLPPLARVWTGYRNRESLMQERPESVFITRVLPRTWLAERARPGSRLGVSRALSFALPPVWDLGFPLVDGSFNFVALDSKLSENTWPPTKEDLSRSVDILISSDELESNMILQFRHQGLEEQERSWVRFFSELSRYYASVPFNAKVENYFLRRTTLYIIHPESIIALPKRANDPYPAFRLRTVAVIGSR